MATNQALVEAIYQCLFGGHVPAATARGAAGMGIRYNYAAAADPQNVWANLFTIAGGVIIVTGLFGVRTVIQAGGASNMQFRHSVGPTVLCAAAAIGGDAVGTLYTITGDTTDPLQIGAAGAPIMLGRVIATSTTYGAGHLFFAGPGTIDVTMTAVAGTGSTRYILTYIPLDDAVTVV